MFDRFQPRVRLSVRFSLLLLLLFGTIAPTVTLGQAAPAQDFDGLMASADKAYRAAKFDDAVASLKQAMELTQATAAKDGKYLRAANALARAYHAKLDEHNVTLAIINGTKAVNNQPPTDDPLSYAMLMLSWGDQAAMSGRARIDPWSSMASKVIHEHAGEDSAAMGLFFRQRALALWIGQLRQAGDDAEKAIKLLGKHLGKEHLDTAIAFDLLGRIRAQSGNSTEAIMLLRYARNLFKKHLDEKHTLFGLNDFYHGQALMNLNRPRDALPYLQSALAIQQAVLDEKTGQERMAFLRGHLARCQEALGQWPEALAGYDAAYKHYRNTRMVMLKPHPMEYAMIGRVRAALKLKQHDVALAKAKDAIGQFKRWRPAAGTDRGFTLFQMFAEAGQHQAAVDLAEKLVSFKPVADLKSARNEAKAPDGTWKTARTTTYHAAGAGGLIRQLTMSRAMAMAYKELGNKAKENEFAERTQQLEALAVEALDNEPGARRFIRAHEFHLANRMDDALLALTDAMTLRHQLQRQLFAGKDKDARLTWMMRDARYMHLALATAIRVNSSNPKAAGLAMDLVMRFHAADYQTVAEESRIAREADDAHIRKLASDLFDRRQKLGQMLVTERDPTLPANQAEGIEELSAEVKSLESRLSEQSARIAALNRQRHVDWQALSETLPDDAVYIHYVYLFDVLKQQTGMERSWLAFTLRKGEQPKLFALSEGNDANVDVREFLFLLKGGGEWTGDVNDAQRSVAYEVSDWVLAPIWNQINDAKRWIITTDAGMAELPIALLPQPVKRDRLVFEDYQISYAVTGSQIADFGRPLNDQRTAVIVADPTFDRAVRPPAGAGDRNGAVIPDPVKDFNWTPLPGTRQEALAILKRLRKERFAVKTYVDERATKAAALSAKSPRILHLATHGFFLPHSRMYLRPHPFLETQLYLDEQGRLHDRPLKPLDGLLYSGLALAGANEGPDGILTAYEWMGADLADTQVVVLSACDTALGTEIAGEAVRGLSRSLLLSGARSVVMSKWKVPDRETAELMDLFYKHLLATDAPAKALQLAMIEMRDTLRQQGRPASPDRWGAFIVMGDPGQWK